MVSARIAAVSVNLNLLQYTDQDFSESAVSGDSANKPSWVAVTESIANRPMTNTSARNRVNRSIFIKLSVHWPFLRLYKHIKCRLP